MILKLLRLSIVFLLLGTFVNASDIKIVKAIGVGKNERVALEDAFRNAIEESVGVFVDSKTVIENKKIIKDEILTASNAYIEKYDLISSKTKDGLIEVEIEAKVKEQEVYGKLKSLNISTISVDNTKNIFARLATKLKAKKDAKKILKKELGEFFSTKSILEMLKIKILEQEVLEKEAKDGEVPIKIKYEITVNYENYHKKISHLKNILINLGAKKKSSSLIIKKEGVYWSKKQPHDYKVDSKKNFGFVIKDKNKFILDTYDYPMASFVGGGVNFAYSDSIKTHIVFKGADNITLESLYQELGSCTFLGALASHYYRGDSKIRYSTEVISGRASGCYNDAICGSYSVFAPLFSCFMLNYAEDATKLTLEYRKNISLELLSKIKDITIELVPKT